MRKRSVTTVAGDRAYVEAMIERTLARLTKQFRRKRELDAEERQLLGLDDGWSLDEQAELDVLRAFERLRDDD